MLFVLFTIAAIGHAIFWTAIVNRLHGTSMKRSRMDALTGACGLAVSMIPVLVFVALVFDQHAAGEPEAARALHDFVDIAVWSYVILCATACIVAAAHRLWMLHHPERRGVMLANHTTRINLRNCDSQPLAAPGVPAWLARLPGNQVFDLHVHEKHLAIPCLTAPHVGLRIAHLSDLHMSGRIAKRYFEEMAEQVNACRPDLIAVTGDLVERDACLDWIAGTLGRLHAPGGVFYVLGNHDHRVDQQRLSAALADAGLIHIGGRTQAIKVRDASLLLAGNELPWYGPAPQMPASEGENDGTHAPLRILLAHSPDQFGWAQKNDFDLMLAGHNHGGQVRVPLLGAIVAPSLHGTRYAAGAFVAGHTVLHVSRGTSSLTPLRYFCPPEIALLELRALTPFQSPRKSHPRETRGAST